jgi:hypothetical protein
MASADDVIKKSWLKTNNETCREILVTEAYFNFDHVSTPLP